MQSRFRIDLAHLDDVIARLAGFVGFVEESLEVLDQRLATLPESWSGKDSEAYADAHRRWMSGAQDLSEGMEAIRAAARRAHEQYTGAVTANLQMLGRGGVE